MIWVVRQSVHILCGLLVLVAFQGMLKAQTCTTVQGGNWSSASTWSCTGGATPPPDASFTGTIIINKAINFDQTLTISGSTSISVSSGGSIDFGNNKVLTLSNQQSAIYLASGSSISGGSANSQIVIGASPNYTFGPFNGHGSISGPNILTSSGLPVNLVSFTAKPQGEHVQINWETTWEQNADVFEIQRSQDLGEFTTVGKVAAQGNTDQHQYYGFLDQHPLDGANYYRLKQVDEDGQVALSKIQSVVMDNLTPSLELLENPIDGQVIRVAVRNLVGATYQLITLTGKELTTIRNHQSDATLVIVPVQPLSSGVYLLRVMADGEQLVRKVLVR
ncbi:T9SS type A sorting domain-containing protein [Spirosoma sp. SC4-14]|uniref:T9SS type A sorting domain-containing protein n=1 Tax=Spirosoma sp. SC4-14 TaxID=3128900 RepID=UPI0030CA6141